MKNLTADLLVLLSKPLTAIEFCTCLPEFHPVFANVVVEENISEENFFYLLKIKCGNSLIRIFQVDAPLHPSITQKCLVPGQYADKLEQNMQAHTAHLLLSHLNSDLAMLDQYTILTNMAWALLPIGAVGVLNETAHSSLPLTPIPIDLDRFEYIKTLPLPLLFCGLATFKLEGSEIVWSRTLGAEKFNRSNIAVRLDGTDINSFQLFSDYLTYGLETEKEFQTGEIVEYGGHQFIIRGPYEDEYFFIEEGKSIKILDLVSTR